MGNHVSVHVECYSGHEYAERPMALYWEDERLQVTDVESSWITPEGKAFQVRLEDGRVCVLTYSSLTDDWSIDWAAA
jgi:hypothetical protein